MSPRTHRQMLHEALTGGGTVAKEWGRSVQLVREAKGKTRKDIAALADVDYNTVRKVELGEMAPSDHLKCAIASALDTPADRLFPLPTIERINALYLADPVAS